MLALIPVVGPLISIAALVGEVLLAPLTMFNAAGLATLVFAF